jgi:hypothetical protein
MFYFAAHKFGETTRRRHVFRLQSCQSFRRRLVVPLQTKQTTSSEVVFEIFDCHKTLGILNRDIAQTIAPLFCSTSTLHQATLFRYVDCEVNNNAHERSHTDRAALVGTRRRQRQLLLLLLSNGIHRHLQSMMSVVCERSTATMRTSSRSVTKLSLSIL